MDGSVGIEVEAGFGGSRQGVPDSSRLRVPAGVEVLLPFGSACHSKRGCTTALVEELYADVYAFNNCEL